MACKSWVTPLCLALLMVACQPTEELAEPAAAAPTSPSVRSDRVYLDTTASTGKELKKEQGTISIRRKAGKPVSGKPEYERPGYDICKAERTEGPTGESWQTGKDFGYTVDEVLPEGLKKKDSGLKGFASAAHRIYLRVSDKGKEVYIKRGIAITGKTEKDILIDDMVLAVINTQGNLITVFPNPSFQLADLVRAYNSLVVGPAR